MRKEFSDYIVITSLDSSFKLFSMCETKSIAVKSNALGILKNLDAFHRSRAFFETNLGLGSIAKLDWYFDWNFGDFIRPYCLRC